MLRRPVQPFPRIAEIEFVVVVRNVHHPRPDESLFAKHFVFDPGAGLGEALRHRARRPVLIVDQASKRLLQFAIGHHVIFAEKNRPFTGKLAPPVDDALDPVEQILKVQIWLSGVEVTGIDAGARPFFVNARDLLGKKRRMAFIVVYARRPHEDRMDVATLLADQLLGADFRFAVGQIRVQRRSLVDQPAAPDGGMDQHRADKHELVDIEILQRFEQSAGSHDRNLVIFGIWFAGKIEIGSKMDEGGDLFAISGSNAFEGRIDARLVGHIATDALGFCRWMGSGVAVESDHTVIDC